VTSTPWLSTLSLYDALPILAEPNEALIISGLREHETPGAVGESLGFKIVTGKGTLVLPGIQQVRRLSLDLREAELAIDCVTHQRSEEHTSELQSLAYLVCRL